MVRISLRGISVTDAEQALAQVWCRAEECGADPPRLRFRFLRDGRVTIQFCFPDPATADAFAGAFGWALPRRLAIVASRHRNRPLAPADEPIP
jgi:hypothetical protein